MSAANGSDATKTKRVNGRNRTDGSQLHRLVQQTNSCLEHQEFADDCVGWEGIEPPMPGGDGVTNRGAHHLPNHPEIEP